jgi:prephenate dehydratase
MALHIVTRTFLTMQTNTTTVVHTLGPEGTNCETAAQRWLLRGGKAGTVRLHDTLETAAESLLHERNGVLLGCVVYPRLHELVFGNLAGLELTECFVMPTHEMVLAHRDRPDRIRRVATHPAPRKLLAELDCDVITASSNSAAAELCSNGQVDACITTAVAARDRGLAVLENYGPVSMGFSIHALREHCTGVGSEHED